MHNVHLLIRLRKIEILYTYNTVTSSKTMSENKSRMNSKLFSQNKTNDRPRTEGSKDKSPKGYTLVIGYRESAVGWGHIFVTNWLLCAMVLHF